MNSTTMLLALALAAGELSPPAANPPAANPPVAAAAPGMLTLDQALKEAQAKNLDLKQAQARVKQVSEAWYKVLAQYLPQISLGGGYTRNQYQASFDLGVFFQALGMPTPPGANLDYTIQKYNQFAGQATLQQAIIVPALWPAFDLADLGEKLATQSTEMARREILFGVAQLYYGAVGLKQVIDVQEKLLKNQLDHEKDAKVRVDAGAMPKIVLIRAQIDRARAEQDVVRARVSYASMKVALATMLDHEGDFEVVQPDEPQLPRDPGQLEGEALKERPDLVVARTSVELAEKNKKSVLYQYFPALVGRFTYQGANIQGFTNSYFQWSASLLLNWTIWDGGLRESTTRENDAKLVEAQAALRSTENKAKDELKRALLDLDSARANRSKAEEQARLARENMQLINVNYQAGAATQIDISDANTALEASELGLIAETLNSQLSALKVLKAAGAFNPQP